MSNKYWKEELNSFGEKIYILYFRPFNDEKELLRFIKNKDGDYVYVIELLKVEGDYLDFYCDETTSIEQVKLICEDMIEEHYEDEINYYEELLRLFKEK